MIGALRSPPRSFLLVSRRFCLSLFCAVSSSLHPCVCFCVSVRFSVCLSVCVSECLSILLTFWVCVSVCECECVWPSVTLSPTLCLSH